MKCAVTALKKGIIRISAREDMPENYLFRYGLIKLPKAEEVEGFSFDGERLMLPGGRTLDFELRREDGVFWKEEEEYLLKHFAKDTPIKLNIEGKPQEEKLKLDDKADGIYSDRKFGISFALHPEEKFYGLGEGGRDRIQLRGHSYQNWTVYQFDEIPIPFVMSSENWGILIGAQDRHFVDIDDYGTGRLTVLGNFDELDIFLVYGNSMKELLGKYTELTGKSMLLPKWAYGFTYIAQLHQNQFEILNDAMKFREKHIPCDNISLEPGWMKKFYDYSFEKDWDLTKFHMETWMRSRECEYSFPTVLRRFGFHMALWMCMNYDLCDEEERKVTGKGQLPAWYEHVRKFVDDGADGFKLDPADMVMRIDPDKKYTNGQTEFAMHNISQVLVMKQMFEGFVQQTGKRPFIHYCGGYTGQQHWGAATTGDNGGLEGSMIWLLNLAMSGFMNTTVDMNIYKPQAIHFGMLAPWAHHNAWKGVSQPWYAGEENERIYTFYARLRYRLLPYIYSTAVEGAETGVPMIRPMALEFQKDPSCAELCHQYMLGENLLIGAFTEDIYLPKGGWIDYWTGEEYRGEEWIHGYVPPKDRGGALFIKQGAILPMWKERDYVGQYGEEEIELHIYPKKETTFYLFYEDDGESLEHQKGIGSHTLISCLDEGDLVRVHIGERKGDYHGKPGERRWKVVVHKKNRKFAVTCEEKNAVIETKRQED